MEDELNQMIEKYTEEITEGRRWIEAEREKLSAGRMAFQEEQLGITEYLELRRDELEAYKVLLRPYKLGSTVLNPTMDLAICTCSSAIPHLASVNQYLVLAKQTSVFSCYFSNQRIMH